MNSPGESHVLDLIFPPEECVWQEEAERYGKYGHTQEEVPYYSGWVPYLGYGYGQQQ